jgi:hypothetical protein
MHEHAQPTPRACMLYRMSLTKARPRSLSFLSYLEASRKREREHQPCSGADHNVVPLTSPPGPDSSP